MNEEENQEMIDSTQLLTKLTELDRRVKAQSDDRHRVNGILHGTLNNIVNRTDMQDQVLSQIQDSVQTMAGSVHRVEVCLIGDPKFDRQGLIKDVIEIKAINIALAARIGLTEEAAKANAAELRNQRRAAMWTVGILTAVGGFITWLKNLFSQ